MKKSIPKRMGWEEIQLAFPDSWVILGNPEWAGASVVSGHVLFHGADKRLVCMEAPARRAGFDTITAVFTGKSAVVVHSGLIRPIRQA